MNVLFRYLSSEAIENCITCLNFKFDEVVFFGQKNIIAEEKHNIKTFLESKLPVITHFEHIDNFDIDEISDLVKSYIKKTNNNYFDMTGNESILQVAMTSIAYELNIPMHIYDVWNNKVLNIDDDIKGNIFDVKINNHKLASLSIAEYIKMVGGSVRFNMEKPEKNGNDYSSYLALNRVKKFCGNNWIALSSALQKCSNNKENSLRVYSDNIRTLLNNAYNKISEAQLIEYLDELASKQLISCFTHNGKGLAFTYKSKYVKKTILKAGSIFEQEVFKFESKNADDCMIGVHLDWNDIDVDDTEVINEIDVLKLNGYILTFISCKDTEKLNNKALYELETVTRRFGGKYSKMKLVCNTVPKKTFIKRASSIGISVIQKNELLKKDL